MNSSNPVLREGTFRGQGHVISSDDRMTVNGTVWKSGVLIVLVAFTFMWTWDMFMRGSEGSAMGIGMGGMLVGLVLSLVISFKPKMAPILAPVFALAQGTALGGISALYETNYGQGAGMEGIVFQAMLGTVLVFVSMLTLFRSGIIKVTERMRAIVVTAMLGVFLVYLAQFALSLFGTGIPGIFDNGAIGIGFSLLVIGIASMMLVIDFDMIQRGAASGAPKYMEWYGAFALLVTIVWIYLELLRLLSKLRSR
jgi:uncharacterized YccA/Bax inhibitor family protein